MADETESHPQQNETLVTRQDFNTPFERETNQSYKFVLKAGSLRMLEFEDSHFHFNSAIFLPDHGGADEIDPADRNRVVGSQALAACYLHAEQMPSNKMLIAGHTDRSGPDDYNFTLSEARANNMYHLLMGEKDAWVKIAVEDERSKVEDLQQILTWIDVKFGYGCDPGGINNHMNAATRNAVLEFQKRYNIEFEQSIGEDGDPQGETWGAFFDVYMMDLRLTLRVDDDGLQAYRDKLQFLDADKPTVGCGEKHPITEAVSSNQRSQVDRRVHVLFFDPPHLPALDCHGESCDPSLCQIYGANRAFAFDPLPWEPNEVGRRFRVQLRLGDISKLFTAVGSTTHSDTGIRQRLQAVGFLYEKLDSSDIADVAQHAWEHFKLVEQKPVDAEAAARLEEMLREEIVDGGEFPEEGDFGKVRFPGSWCIRNDHHNASPGFLSNPGPAGSPHKKFTQEKEAWEANPALGLIPVEAFIEERTGNDWGPARPGVKVHFQLVEPDEIPAGSDARAPALRDTTLNTQKRKDGKTWTMVSTGSPKNYVDTERARVAVTADDPQVDNAATVVGGKRGNDVVGTDRMANVLEIDNSHSPFHDTLNTATASPHDNAVEVETNDAGQAAAILMPSRTGGDRYKIRVWVDPIPEEGHDQASSGTETFAVAAETGTMVVWRMFRFSKYIRWDYPAGVARSERRRGRGALNNIDFSGVMADEYAKAWLDVTVEALARSPQTLTQAQWSEAIRYAKPRAQARITPDKVPGNWNLDVLLPHDTNPHAGLIRFLSASEYDAAAKGPAPAGGWEEAVDNDDFLTITNNIMRIMKDDVVHFFTRNAISGLTVIQTPMMSSIESRTNAGARLARSGFGGPNRGCFLTFGSLTYATPTGVPSFPYDHNSNTLHECGHTLYGPHQFTHPNQIGAVATGAGKARLDEHDYGDLCIMGYMTRHPTTADYCGRCSLMLAGWNTHGIPTNSAPGAITVTSAP